MRSLQLQLPESSDPAYIRIATAVTIAIQDGRLLPGSRLPSTRELASSFDVHRQTVMSALAELVAQGWLIAYPRSGYAVNSALPTEQVPPRKAIVSQAKVTDLELVLRDTEIDVDLDPREFDYAFRAESPDLREFPTIEYRRLVAQCLRQNCVPTLDYAASDGCSELAAQLRSYVGRVRSVANKHLILTNGAQEGIYLVSRLLLNEKASVAVEPLGYPPAWRAFRATGAKLVPLRTDKHGIITESLERAARKFNLRLIYLTPLHQFPTTVTLPLERRIEIYRIAREHRIAILEDDYDHEFHYNRTPLAPMASTDPGQIVFYVFSLSKLAFPSLRIGGLMSPPDYAKHLLSYRQLAMGNPGQILSRATALWMRSGGFERHMWKMQRLYRKRRDLVVAALTRLRENGRNLAFSVPDGGMAVWINMREDTEKLAQRARERGVLLQVENSYKLTPGIGTHVRLGFANQNSRELIEGLRVVEDLIST